MRHFYCEHVRTNPTFELLAINAMDFDKSKKMTNLYRFTNSKRYTGDEPGPLSPHIGERRSKANMSRKTSNFPVGDAQKQCASELSNCKVNPIGGDGLIGAKRMNVKYKAELSCPRGKIDRNEED